MSIPAPLLTLRIHSGRSLPAHFSRLGAYLRVRGVQALSRHPGWLSVLRDGLGHTPYLLEAGTEGRTVGVLPLAFVESLLFGKFLVGLPYLNSGGVTADNDGIGAALVSAAVRLADRLAVKYLELRHERQLTLPQLTELVVDKVHQRLDLPGSPGRLWEMLPGKVRNQVRKGQRKGLSVSWGGEELLGGFYTVFSHSMRDLGTPVYPRQLFHAIFRQYPSQAEICLVRADRRPVAAGLLLHGWGVAEVPSAASLREFNGTNANMLLYWHLLARATEKGQSVFDFGRSTPGSGTFRFKKQWGAQPTPACWQYHRRDASASIPRPSNPKYQRAIALWKKLPLSLTRLLGPLIVRGIP